MTDEPTAPDSSSFDDLLTSPSLLQDARLGSPDAWENIVIRYRPWITRYCRKSGMSHHDAENISQEVFIDLFRRIETFERGRKGSFRKFLSKISHSRIVDFIRRMSRHREETHDPHVIAAIMEDQFHTSAGTNPETIRRYQKTMAKLNREFSDRDIKILVMCLADEREPEEIAAEFGVSVNTVYLTKSRVLKKFRDALDDLRT